MLKRFYLPLVWLTGLLLVGLWLTACGGATESTSPTEEVTATKEAITAGTTATAVAAASPTANSTTTPKKASCQAINIPTNDKVAPVSASDWSKGPTDAPVTVIEYADFQCPGCAGVSPMVDKLKQNYGDELRLVYRHMPLITIHDKAQITAEAAEAAGAQGKFWEMHDLLFERQSQWSSKTEAEMINVLVGYAKEIGVTDLDKFKTELEKDTYADKVLASYQAGIDGNINSTPSFIVNQLDYPAENFGLSYQGLDAFIKLVKLRERWYEKPEQVIDPQKQYIATIETEKGKIVIELFADTAPVNVNSFVFLAQKGWYKGVTFHRVLPDFVAQGGDPTDLGIGFPGYRCDDEITPKRTFDEPGVVSLANSGPDTNGSQFFITYTSTVQLNDGFTIIGQVVEGMDVAKKLTPRDLKTMPDAQPGDKIIDITVAEKKD